MFVPGKSCAQLFKVCQLEDIYQENRHLLAKSQILYLGVQVKGLKKMLSVSINVPWNLCHFYSLKMAL